MGQPSHPGGVEILLPLHATETEHKRRSDGSLSNGLLTLLSIQLKELCIISCTNPVVFIFTSSTCTKLRNHCRPNKDLSMPQLVSAPFLHV